MTRFEYRIIEHKGRYDLDGQEQELNVLGRDGWEVCFTTSQGYGDGILILKRPLPND